MASWLGTTCISLEEDNNKVTVPPGPGLSVTLDCTGPFGIQSHTHTENAGPKKDYNHRL